MTVVAKSPPSIASGLRAALVVLLSLAAPALAQPAVEAAVSAGEAQPRPAEPAPGAADRDAYGEWIDLAIEEFAANRYREAFAAFSMANGIYPNARALRGMAMASYELRSYPAALQFGERALAEQERRLTPELRAQVERIVARSRAFVAIYQVELDPPDALLRLDGAAEAWAQEAGRLIVGLGEHTLRVTAPGHEPLGRQLMVAGGEEQTLRLVLLPEAPPAPPPHVAGPAVVPPPPAAAVSDHVSDQTLPWVWFGAGAAALLGAGGSSLWVVDRQATVTQCEEELTRDWVACANYPTLLTERDASIAVTIVLSAVGLGLLTAGITLLLDD